MIAINVVVSSPMFIMTLWSVLSFFSTFRCACGFSIINPKDTCVNAAGRTTSTVAPPPSAILENVTLSNYMRLPVDQYVLIPMPLGSSLTRVKKEAAKQLNENRLDEYCREGNSIEEEFELVVPTIKFFNLSVQPVVYASVSPQHDKVIISSDKCLLRGSPFIEKVKLNERFDFKVRTTLTWDDPLSDESCNKNIRSRRERNKMNGGKGSITAETKIDVKVDVPRPFSSIPRVVLEKTGNAAMNMSMKLIQGNFVNNLAKDYEKWANDFEYRSFRASLSEKSAESSVFCEV
mmetsp:Transcript_2853/g.5732  ORF Transcript_2853/g.5732 Transcript_2853/m.5732 type:complete len:291 (+) Transcript_2853:2-874(+)